MNPAELWALALVLRLTRPDLPMRKALEHTVGRRTLSDTVRPGCAHALTECLARLATTRPVSARKAA